MSEVAAPRGRLVTWAVLAGESAAWTALLVCALAVRLIDLGDRPFHHDESQDAYFSWALAERGDYEYNPLLHPPLRFYLVALTFLAFGDSDFTARLMPALAGTLTVALAWPLRPLLGRQAAFFAAALMAFGPTFLYFSRFAREDIYTVCVTLALLVATFRFLDSPRRWQPALIGALLAAAFATKESTFITVFVAGTFFIVWLLYDIRVSRRGGGRSREARLLQTLGSVGREAWGWGAIAFLAVYIVLFTTFFTDPQHWDALWEGLDYWLGQHDVGRGGEPWYFYLVLLFGEEWPALLLGGIGAAVTLRRPTALRLFLIWDFVLSLVVYSWAGEKFSWLLLHPLLPLTLLAGFGAQELWAARGRWLGRAGLAAAAVAVAYLVFASWSVNVERRADPAELLVTTQSSEEVKRVADQVVALASRGAREENRRVTVTVDSAEGATFPWAWYFRDLPGTGYLEMTAVEAPPPSDVLILTEANQARLEPALGAYAARRFPFRVWWVRDYGAMSVGNWWRWLVRREPWNPTGGMPEWLLVRRGL